MKILAWCFGVILAQMCSVDMMDSLTKCPGPMIILLVSIFSLFFEWNM